MFVPRMLRVGGNAPRARFKALVVDAEGAVSLLEAVADGDASLPGVEKAPEGMGAELMVADEDGKPKLDEVDEEAVGMMLVSVALPVGRAKTPEAEAEDEGIIEEGRGGIAEAPLGIM